MLRGSRARTIVNESVKARGDEDIYLIFAIEKLILQLVPFHGCGTLDGTANGRYVRRLSGRRWCSLGRIHRTAGVVLVLGKQNHLHFSNPIELVFSMLSLLGREIGIGYFDAL